MSAPVRIGMIGGGPDAFIGAVHRMAMRLDGQFELVAGAFSASAARSSAMGKELGLDPKRAYASWQEMAASEAALPADQRIEAVAIVTPNFLHHEPAIDFLNRGFHVICDKPMTITSALAAEMQAAVERSGKVFTLTHNYSGYPMVREARALVQSGALGDLRKVFVEYLQGWLGDPIENDGQKQALWRTDPQKTGPGGSLGDIGTHAFHLLEHITADRVTNLYGRRHNFVAGRQVDDDAMLLLEMNSGATGTLVVSQVCAGAENNLRIRIHGSEGGLLWEHENPNELQVFHKDGVRETRRVGSSYLQPSAQSLSRVPSGHPEGYVEAFANIYRAFACAIRTPADIGQGVEASAEDSVKASYPTVADGCRGVRFIEAAIESSAIGQWVALSE